MKATRLRCEYLKDPIGIDITSPRLFWNCESGIRQSAYQIVANDDEGNLLLDTGKVESSSMHYQWQVTPVRWRTRVNWKVRLFDENDVPSEYAEAFFETGLPAGEK